MKKTLKDPLVNVLFAMAVALVGVTLLLMLFMKSVNSPPPPKILLQDDILLMNPALPGALPYATAEQVDDLKGEVLTMLEPGERAEPQFAEVTGVLPIPVLGRFADTKRDTPVAPNADFVLADAGGPYFYQRCTILPGGQLNLLASHPEVHLVTYVPPDQSLSLEDCKGGEVFKLMRTLR